MFNTKPTDSDKIDLDVTIDAALIELSGYSAENPEYDTILDKIERLYAIKDNTKKSKKAVSPDALVSAGASLLGIGLILSYEHLAPVTSKALSFVTKVKP